MNKLIGLLLVATLSACSSLPDKTYFKVGAGYKLDESVSTYYRKGKKYGSEPVTARFEIGSECGNKNITCGISHHSQWLAGKPFNNDSEYSKTEIFIDYKWELN